MYCKYDENTKKCTLVGTGSNEDFYKSIGLEDLEVEQAYNGDYYLKGYAPSKSDDEVALEELEQQENTLSAQIAELKDQLLTATLADDTEQVEAIKAEYQNLVGV